MSGTIVPFCIYHRRDPINKNHRGIITNPISISPKDGKLIYSCGQQILGTGWKYTGTFYAVSPMFRPIPVGMRMFCAELSELSGVVSLTDVTISYGLFDFKPNCVYFITYNQPVIHTVPLYFHKHHHSIFPSFDPTPPGPDWTQTTISPIFVLISGLVDPNDPDNTKFHCINNRCLPWDEDEVIHYNLTEEKQPYTLGECVVTCNEAVGRIGVSQPVTILETVSNMSKEKTIFPYLFRKLPSPVIGLVVGCFVFVLLLLMYSLSKNRIDRGK